MIRSTSTNLDHGYLATPTGQLNIAEILCLIGALISVAFTSSLYCELVDNIRWIYPELSTVIVRSVFQTFTILCLTITIIILLVHLFGIRYTGRNFVFVNQLCLGLNVLTGLMMISIGICAAFWEDKLRRTPGVLRRGYLTNEYQWILGEMTHPRPGAAAAAATFALLAGILFIIEACTRPMLGTGAERVPHYVDDRLRTVPIEKTNIGFGTNFPTTQRGERVIPIETTYSPSRL